MALLLCKGLAKLKPHSKSRMEGNGVVNDVENQNEINQKENILICSVTYYMINNLKQLA